MLILNLASNMMLGFSRRQFSFRDAFKSDKIIAITFFSQKHFPERSLSKGFPSFKIYKRQECSKTFLVCLTPLRFALAAYPSVIRPNTGAGRLSPSIMMISKGALLLWLLGLILFINLFNFFL